MKLNNLQISLALDRAMSRERFSLRSSLAQTSGPVVLLALVLAMVLVQSASAQITNIVFSDDFEDAMIDPNLYQADAPFFEGGQGNISATEANGVVEFTGTVSQQWWAGATLRVVPTFSVSDETNLVVSVDRVSEAGVGTASRSALWIMDGTRTKYILFADVRLEGGWTYNRKIDEAGDVPTGSGVNMASFDPFDDGGFHVMKAVANGKTVRLYLDDIFGAEVRFPYSDLVVQFGSYARATGDAAHTIFDNLKIETVGKAAFSRSKLSLTAGQTSSDVQVRIPLGANAAAPVELRVISSDPSVVTPVGAVDGTLTLTFEAGGPNTKALELQPVTDTGGARLTLTNDIGLEIANMLDVVIVESAGVRLEDEFAGASLDTTLWETSAQGFEDGQGFFDVTVNGGVLDITGDTSVPFWAGASIRTLDSFTATEDLPLTVELDRVAVDPSPGSAAEATAVRSGVFLTTADRSTFIFFGQNLGETGWVVNLNPGNPTGSGTAISAFASLNDQGEHHLKLVANGETADVYLDDIFGGRFNFPLSSGIRVEVGAYARDVGDAVSAQFDNVRIENSLACFTASAAEVTAIVGQSSDTITVTIPQLLNASADASVTVSSANPSVAVPTGGANGSLTLNFPAGGTTVQTFDITGVGLGVTTFSLTSTGICGPNDLNVTVTSVPAVLLSDDFSNPAVDPGKWRVNPAPLGAGTATAGSEITITNEQAGVAVTGETLGWPGLALATVGSYTASLTSPATFEIDRVSLSFVLVTGDVAKQRAGIWITDSTRLNYVFFSDFSSHNVVIGGWQYHRQIGQEGDNPVSANDTLDGIPIPAFAPARFNDLRHHRITAVANGSTVKLYLDDVLGAEVAFPFSEGIVFEFGAYVRDATDRVFALFDNARVLGQSPVGTLSSARQSDGRVLISWDGPGVLQSANVLGDPDAWTDVTPAPVGTSLTVDPASQGAARFYRLREP